VGPTQQRASVWPSVAGASRRNYWLKNSRFCPILTFWFFWVKPKERKKQKEIKLKHLMGKSILKIQLFPSFNFSIGYLCPNQIFPPL